MLHKLILKIYNKYKYDIFCSVAKLMNNMFIFMIERRI